MSRNRYLLVTRAGPQSLHPHWLEPAGERRFDIFVSAYDAKVAPIAGDGLFFEHRPGRKVAGYGAFLREQRALWSSYDYVGLFDDDLLIDAAAISRLFALADRHDLKLAQPALTPESYFTYAALLRHPGFQLRYMTYIEMMCPVFRTDALASILSLFDLGFESGIDIIWSNLIGRGPRDLAVIDAVSVRHTRRVGSGKSANGFGEGKTYEDDIGAILRRFGCPWLPCLPYEGLGADGRTVTRRPSFFPDALALAAAIPLRAPMKMRTRNVAVYWKHLLTAPARNVALDWPEDLTLTDR